MSLFGTSWDKIEIKRIPGIGDGPDVPGGSKRPRKLIPAVFDPKSADADSDGWRQEGTTARWYGLIPSSPIYKNVLSHFKKIKDPQNDTTWLPFGNTTVEEWLGTIDRVENGRLKAPPVELSTMEADLSFVAGHIDLKTRQAQARGVEAPSIAYESRRAAAWVKGREIQRKRFGKSSEVLSGDDESVLARADAFIDALKRKRVERDKKIAKDFELDDDTKRLARNFDITKFLDPQPDYDQWKKEWEENNPEPIRGDFATEELYEAALENWDEQRTFDYEDLIMGSDSDQELLDALDEIFSFEFETELGNKYYFSFQYQQNASQETIDLHFSVFTIGDRKVELPDGTEVELPDGSQVGNGTRTINFYDSNVYNDYFSLSDEVRGEQISTIVAARNEQIYAQMGIKEVIVGASSSEKMNGATHWPKVGFDWDNAGERDYYVELIQSALDKFSSEILDNPDELPTIAAERNDKIVSVPLFASKEEAEIVLALIEKVKTQRFDDKDRLTAGDLVNWSGAEFWFMKKGANSQLRKALGPAVAPPQVKWLRIESRVKAVKKPNLPNTPKKPGVGGGGPSKPRALKPAVFDPKSVDVDNDGWHQEGTTAAWFGAGLNNPVVQALKQSLGALGDDDKESSYNAMIATGGYGIFEGAPSPEISTPEADLAWLGGKIVLQQQQQGNASRNPLDGPPPRGFSSDSEFKLEAQWLQGRDEARRRGGVREQVVPTPEIEKLDDQTVIEAIDKAITARKERRAILDAKTRVKADDAASDEVKEKAKAFNFEDYPPDDDVELLEMAEWKENYADAPEKNTEYPLGGTQEELDAYNESMRQYMQWSADVWDEYVEYRRTQEGLKHAELRNALAEIYEYEFLGNDGKTYSTKLNSAMKNESGSFSMSGKIYNESGEEVGFFDRTFVPDEATVYHDHLKLEEGTRGSQISGILNSRNEIMYQEMGYETIALGALSGQDYNGATHWPKLGYDWLDEDQKELGLRAVEDALTEFALAIKENPDALPMMTKVIEDKDDPDIKTEVRIPIFASREEAESVALLIAIARDQEFGDSDGLTAGDFVNWSGAELFFQQKGIQIELSRAIGGQRKSADVPDVTPDADASVSGISAKGIQEKSKQQVRRRVLGKKKSMAGGIEFKAVNKPNKPNLPNTPRKPSLGGGGSSKPRALKPAVFDPRSADADGDGWRQEGTTARWYGVGLNSPIVESLRSEMMRIQGGSNQDLTHMANLNQGYFRDAPPPLGSTLEADLAWLGGQLSLASVVNPGVIEGQWLLGREQVRKQGKIREEVLPTPDISELSDSDILKNLEQIIDTRKKARVAKDAKTRVSAPDNVSDEALAAARDFDIDTADPNDIDTDVKAMFNFEFIGMDGQKYSAEIQRSYLQKVKYEDGSSPRRLSINGKIFKDGKEVGFFDRTIYPDTKTVVHDHMHLDDEVRGAQISGIINARNELIYRSLGCDVITTKAASTIGYNGATHWPKVGFDWQDDYAREVYFAAVDSALTEFALGIDKDPDILPMMQKYDPKSGMFAFVPIFSSREEAEEVALLLTLARTQSMDDPDRLTAGDLVNWSGAESWFQVNAVEGGLVRSIGGQEQVADVPEVADALQNAEEVAELPKILTISDRDQFKEVIEKLKLGDPETSGPARLISDKEDVVGEIREGFLSLLEVYSTSGNRRSSTPWIPTMPGVNAKPIEESTLEDDIEYAFSMFLRAGYTQDLHPFQIWLAVRHQQRKDAAEFSTATPDGKPDYLSDASVEIKNAREVNLNPQFTDDEAYTSELALINFETRVAKRLTRRGAEWRHVSFTDDNGEKISMVRGVWSGEDQNVKTAISYNLGKKIAEGVSVEVLSEFIETELTLTGMEYQRLAMKPNGRLEFVAVEDELLHTVISSEDPMYATFLGEYIADTLLAAWASDSNAGHSLGVQSAAARVADVSDETLPVNIIDPEERIQSVFDLFVTAQYELTQNEFAAQGLKTVVAHRGMAIPSYTDRDLANSTQGGAILISDAEVLLNPLSSTAFDRNIAYRFSDVQTNDGISVVVASEVPTTRFLSTALTGMGCKEEREMLLIGGGETNFQLAALSGSNVSDILDEDIDIAEIPTFRRGDSINLSTTSRLERKGYSEEEIEKIVDGMQDRGLGTLPPSGALDILAGREVSEEIREEFEDLLGTWS